MIRKFQKAERNFIPEYKQTTITENLEKFIKENFKIPDNDLERICSFIRKDRELEKIIFELPALIKSKLSYEKLEIKFFDEFQEEELILEVTAFSFQDFDTILEKEEEFIHILYGNYAEESADKILILIEG